jgi:hypothetical protein
VQITKVPRNSVKDPNLILREGREVEELSARQTHQSQIRLSDP